MAGYEEKEVGEPPKHWVADGDNPVAIFTGRGEGRGFYLGTKGGCGAVSHGHMDAGSFVFELDGVRWSVDPGIQGYMIGEQGFDLWKQHQASERWQLLSMNNHGQPFVVKSLDPPPHRYDKQIEGLKRIELTIPVSAGCKQALEVEIELRGPR